VLAADGMRCLPPRSQRTQSVAVDDLDGDGRLDLVVADDGSDSVSVLLGDGSGGLGAVPAR
jgi:hypothetical protein